MGNEGAQRESLFDTRTERVLRSLPVPAAAILAGLVGEDRIPLAELRAAIPRYIEELERATSKHEFLDIGLARKLADRCLALLDGVDIADGQTRDEADAQARDKPDAETRQLIQAAVRYFLVADDAEGDKESIIGFDDDARVIEVVAREIGREDVL